MDDDDLGWLWLIVAPLILTIAIIVGLAWCCYRFGWWISRTPKRVTVFIGIAGALIIGLTAAIAVSHLLHKFSNMSAEGIINASIVLGTLTALIGSVFYFGKLASDVYYYLSRSRDLAVIPTSHKLVGGFNKYGEIEED